MEAYYVRSKKHHYWGEAVIHEWDKGGTLMIMSDFGNYAFTWISTGFKYLREFLLGLDKQYLMGKLAGSRDLLYEFDVDETRKAVYEDILRYRKDHTLTKEEARELWAEFGNFELSEPHEQSAYYYALNDHCPKLMELLYEAWEGFPDRSVYKSHITGFWEEIWPLFCEVWREELEEENAKEKTNNAVARG